MQELTTWRCVQVRILRDDLAESPSLKGLYPAGEGAGHAGGIVSAAVDGLHVGECILREIHLREPLEGGDGQRACEVS